MEVNDLYGLSDDQVDERIKAGQVNTTRGSMTKSSAQIIKDNICTLFNLLNFIIVIGLAMVGAWSNMVFIAIILANIIIGIAQELKAKKLVEDLSLLSRSEVDLIRNGKQINVHVDDIVMDDLVLLASGKQICCDALVVSGEVEVNESLLTGESDPVVKKAGTHLLSGSSVISGKCHAQVEHVGAENYATQLAVEAKKLRKVQSELMRSMKKVTKLTGFLIIPLGVILFCEAYLLRGDSIYGSVVSSSAGLLGMLPKGLVLLISVSLAGGVIKLAKAKVLVQDLYSLESLAHVDVLCLDKTGTLTEGIMKVEDEYLFNSSITNRTELSKIIGSFLSCSDDTNATFQSLKEYYVENNLYQPINKVPFSSERKWSSIEFKEIGNIIVGAPERLISQQLPLALRDEMKAGKRVIIIGVTKQKVDKDQALPMITPIAGIIIADHVRANTTDTLAYFRSEGVEIKIISGDNPLTVSAIAKEAGLPTHSRYIDMDTVVEGTDFSALVNKYCVFGRTTPLQKKQLVQALQKNGHTVAMTGDGVNDLLAMKEADCSIAVAQGSDAVRQAAQIVLLESDFSALTEVLAEGRRVVHHVTRVAGVFFIKTIYSLVLTILCVLANVPFPFIPIQITLLDAVVEAYPAFLTAFEPKHEKLRGHFLTTAFRAALPNAIVIVVGVVAILTFGQSLGMSQNACHTVAYLLVSVISIVAVIKSSRPFTKLRIFVNITMVIGYVMAILLFHSLLEIEPISIAYLIILLCLGALALLFDSRER